MTILVAFGGWLALVLLVTGWTRVRQSPSAADWRNAKVEGVVVLEFFGGPNDGERKVVPVGLSVWTVTYLVPLVLSPWGEPEATDLCRIVRTGTYHRTAQGMVWSPEEGQ